MSYENQDKTLHETHFFNPNCEYCDENLQIVQSWYLKHWVSATEYARLMKLPF